MDQKTFNAIEKIIYKTTQEYLVGHLLPSSAQKEDMWQTCWLGLLDYEKKSGHELTFDDLKLAKKICQNRIVDWIRDESGNVPEGGLASLDFDPEGDRGSWNHNIRNAARDSEESAEIDELLSMFPEGSRERKYIQFWLESEGIRDFGINPPVTRTKDGYTKSNLAAYLGFNSDTGNSSFKRFDRRMREILADHYGIEQ